MTNFQALTPQDFATPSFDAILPLYQELLEAPLSSQTLPAYLANLHALDAAVEEAATWAQIQHDLDTNHVANKQLRDLWMTDILPKLSSVGTDIHRRILATPGAPDNCQVAFANWSAAEKLFREENIPLQARVAELDSQYSNLLGSLTVQVDSYEFTLPQVSKELESADRPYRERVWRATQIALQAKRPDFATLWRELFDLRQQIAKNAGFTNYRDYVFAHEPTKGYTPEDSASFYQAVAKAAKPILARSRALRQEDLGLSSLRPWDMFADSKLRPPVDLGEGSERLVSIAKAILAKVDPAIGALLKKMEAENLIDLDNRPGKAPGGYNTSLLHSKAPYVFMNAVGSGQDLQTLVHEMGHAYHAEQVLNSICYHWAQHPGSEMCEVASMAMELMSYEHLTPSTTGLTAQEISRLKAEHLEDILAFFAHCTTIDQLQHDLYTHPDGGNLDVVDALYVARRQGVDAGIDWTGLEHFMPTRWHSQLHVWGIPFYYIQYGLAQLASLNLWQKYQQDPKTAFKQYTDALRLGHTCALPKLYEASGTALNFTPEYMAPLLANAEKVFLQHHQQPKTSNPSRTSRL